MVKVISSYVHPKKIRQINEWRANGVFPAYQKLKRMIRKHMFLMELLDIKNNHLGDMNDLMRDVVSRIVDYIKQDTFYQEYFGSMVVDISVESLLNIVRSKRRFRKIIDLKSIVIYILRKIYKFPLQRIADFIFIDHSTVIHHCDRVEGLRAFPFVPEKKLFDIYPFFEKEIVYKVVPKISFDGLRKQFRKLVHAIAQVTKFDEWIIRSCIKRLLIRDGIDNDKFFREKFGTCSPLITQLLEPYHQISKLIY